MYFDFYIEEERRRLQSALERSQCLLTELSSTVKGSIYKMLFVDRDLPCKPPLSQQLLGIGFVGITSQMEILANHQFILTEKQRAMDFCGPGWKRWGHRICHQLRLRGNTPGNQGSGGSNLLVQCPPTQIWDTYRQTFLQNGKKCPCSKTLNLYLKSSLYCLTFYGLQWKLCLTKDHRSEPLLMCIWKKSSVSLFHFHSNLHKSGHFYTNSSHLLLVTGTRGSIGSPYSLMTWHVLCYLSLNKGTLEVQTSPAVFKLLV